jgi:aldose 1-epimerase
MAGILTLRVGELSLRLQCWGGAILDFRLGDLSFLRSAADGVLPGDSACYPLVPLGNRIRDNHFAFAGRAYDVAPNALPEPLHLHGVGWQVDWTVDAADHSFARLVHHHDGANLPHRYRAEQSFALRDNALRMELSVTNTGDSVLPFGLGWHPFFAEAACLTAPARGFWREGADRLPTRRGAMPEDLDFGTPRPLPARWINNAFDGWTAQADLDWPDRGLTINADPIFGCYQIFRPQMGDFFAFEPMSHLPDALSMPDLGGLVPLAPGESLSGGLTLVPRLNPVARPSCALSGDLP